MPSLSTSWPDTSSLNPAWRRFFGLLLPKSIGPSLQHRSESDGTFAMKRILMIMGPVFRSSRKCTQLETSSESSVFMWSMKDAVTSGHIGQAVYHCSPQFHHMEQGVLHLPMHNATKARGVSDQSIG
jgi:hypothetical protein